MICSSAVFIDQCCRTAWTQVRLPQASDAGAFEQLRKTKNVVIYPPIGYVTDEASARKIEVLVANIEAFDAGQPKNHVKPVPQGANA